MRLCELKIKTPLEKARRNTPFLTGFTIIEMAMVIVIMGIMIGVAIPRFNSFYFIKLNGAVKKAISDIRYVQQLAIARHESYTINFSAVNNSYEARKVSDNSYAQDPFSRSNFIVNFDTDVKYKGIDISAANFGGSSSLVFNWQGAPTNGGVVSFSYKGSTINVAVEANTGFTRQQ